ncbi:MAG: 5'/3'-nucleotidase SurE [Selenomonadaceae bacterium]|nr:5'/3'-nucleotidase SurE [Selenomonadaceae bacterium]
MKKILISNDDGIDGVGLWAMANALRKNFEVAIAAPMRQQSGMAHALTLGRRLEYKRVTNSDFETWTVDGTPTDCVKFYLEALDVDKKICAVISGINHGANLATDVLYSGTVGAALEGYLHEIPALAVSLDIHSEISFEQAAFETEKYFSVQFARGEIFFHNVNFPKKFRAGQAEFKTVRLGKRDYLNAFVTQENSDGKNFFEVRGKIFDSDGGEGTDIHAVNHGLISVTPLNGTFQI